MLDPVQEIKARLNVLEVIQEYLHLTKAGGNWRALCPFHQEKTPSFMVSEEKQMYHCFGCGEGGDIFEFVKKMEGIEFPEALRILAKKANVPLPSFNPKLENEKTIILRVLEAAVAHYHDCLIRDARAAGARDYLAGRGIDETTRDLFQFGYAPESWDETLTALEAQKFSMTNVFDAGLLVKKERGVGYYDRFRNRLMIPIRDVHGVTVGFTSRVLGAHETGAKYINTPETPVYHKGWVLFNLDRARAAIKEKDAVIIVEGNMDAISLAQADFANVVASSGTAFTEQQVKLVKRFTANVLLALDHDEAGFEALKRSSEELLRHEMSIRVVDYPDGKDPDECVRKNREGFARAVEKAEPLGDYLFRHALHGRDVSKIDDKKMIAKELLPFIAKIYNPIERSHYLKRLAMILDVSEDVLLPALQKASRAGRRTSTSSSQPFRSARVPHDTGRQLEQELIGLLLRFPEHLEFAIEHLDPETMQDSFSRALYKSLIIYYTEHGFHVGFSYSEPHLRSFLIQSTEKSEEHFEHESGILLLAARSVLPDEMAEQARKEIKERIRRLNKTSIQKKLKAIEQTIRSIEETGGDTEKLLEYSRQFRDLAEELRSIER